MARRPLTEQIPDHLQPFIAVQDASLYTPIDHASWRYILRVSKAFFSKVAHPKYLDGLKETGISTERIPLVDEMDEKLRRFGWRAVPVSGFIPPAAFMEFQSLGILPIACEMRTLEHLAYTPAPDIVHEAAGHAPILADPEYAEYLRAYGEVSRKAILSHHDIAVYRAIRELSEVKEDPASTAERIAASEARLEEATAAIDFVSEASYLSRMNWWTVEYGLVGDVKHPQIYGAGLLSSVGESFHCLGDQVKKIPFTLQCTETAYDITRPQPQLYVTPDFATLGRALEEFSRTMAFRVGGMQGLSKARQARSVTTAQLESGLQISGVLEEFRSTPDGSLSFLKHSGPVQMSVDGHQLENQGPRHHAQGFSSPVGRLRSPQGSASELSDEEFSRGRLEFGSGITLQGRFIRSIRHRGKAVIATFEDCTIRQGPEVLYQPGWGTFDLACGERVVSVFGGASDRAAWLREASGERTGGGGPRHPKSNLTAENRGLNELYRLVREIRESGAASTRVDELGRIHAELDSRYPDDWLLRLELLELARSPGPSVAWEKTARARLEAIAGGSREQAEMIRRGLELL
jgi:phenylalanine-4-hydroxylase